MITARVKQPHYDVHPPDQPLDEFMTFTFAPRVGEFIDFMERTFIVFRVIHHTCAIKDRERVTISVEETT